MKYSKEKLDQYRQQGDPLADHVIEYFISHPDQKRKVQEILTNHELKNFDGDQIIQDLIADVIDYNPLPKYVVKGQQFFESHLMSIMALLGLYSLPYCYAAANGAKVLIHSKNIIENPGQRLGETAQFVLDVCRPGAFDDERTGYVSILKVRLMHAAIRHHASRHIDFETPINQEDMAGTNLSFSLLIVRGLQKLGQHLSEEEIHVYLQLWNFIGKKIGVINDLLPKNSKEFYLLEKAIRKHQFRSSEEGAKLMNALISYFNQNPVQIPGFDVSVAMSALMGKEVSDCLNISSSELTQSAALAVMRTSHFFLSFVQDNFRWISKSIAQQTQKSDFKELYIIPV